MEQPPPGTGRAWGMGLGHRAALTSYVAEANTLIDTKGLSTEGTMSSDQLPALVFALGFWRPRDISRPFVQPVVAWSWPVLAGERQRHIFGNFASSPRSCGKLEVCHGGSISTATSIQRCGGPCGTSPRDAPSVDSGRVLLASRDAGC